MNNWSKNSPFLRMKAQWFVIALLSHFTEILLPLTLKKILGELFLKHIGILIEKETFQFGFDALKKLYFDISYSWARIYCYEFDGLKRHIIKRKLAIGNAGIWSNRKSVAAVSRDKRHILGSHKIIPAFMFLFVFWGYYL